MTTFRRLGVGAIAAILAVIMVRIIQAAQPPAHEQPEICVASDVEVDRIRALMFDAIDQAFKEQIGVLFGVWMRDYRRQPENTLVGARNAVNARITARVRAERWNPPRCK